MENDILVSISCVTFNHVKFIEKCLEGFLMQKCDFNYEILIHDDASTDGTKEIIEKYYALYPDIIKPIFQKENQYSKGKRGFNVKYNFSRAKGKYIALCEGDDYWTDEFKLQKQVDFLEENQKYALCCHRYSIFNVSRGEWKSDYGADLFLDAQAGIAFNNNFNINTCWLTKTMTVVFRNNLVNYKKLEKFKMARDVHLMYYVLKEGKGYCMNFSGAAYNMHKGGVFSQKEKVERMKENYCVYLELKKMEKNNEAINLKTQNLRKEIIECLRKNLKSQPYKLLNLFRYLKFLWREFVHKEYLFVLDEFKILGRKLSRKRR